MLLIPCPWCGQRDETEFRYGGQADVSYPKDPDALDDTEWADYLFMRDNPKGWFTERWVHTYGCRRWFTVVRHTVTQEIAAVSQLAPPFPTTASSTDTSHTVPTLERVWDVSVEQGAQVEAEAGFEVSSS